MRGCAGRRVGLALDPEQQRGVGLVRAIFRDLGRVSFGVLSVVVVRAGRAGAAVVSRALALEVEAHLHLHHLGRALDEVDAGLLVPGHVHGCVRGTAEFSWPAAFAFRRGQRGAEQWVGRHLVVVPVKQRNKER